MKVHLNDQKYILVEMQVRKFENWANRTVVYTCRQVADQANGDFDYGKLEPVVQISIMDYTLFQDNRVFFDQYLPRNEKGYPYTDKIQFYVMDLMAMDEATDEQKKQGLVEWAKAFKAESWEEVREIDNPAVKEGEALTTASGGNFVRAEVIRNKRSALWAVAQIEDAGAKTMELIMSNPTEREWIRMRRDAEIDRRTEIRAAERKTKCEMAKGFKEKGIDPAIIASVTGLPLAEIDAL